MNVADWPRYHYASTVTRIIDGDTIEVMLDFGDRTYRKRRIRLLGYDAPELFGGADREAGARARDGLAALLPIGVAVYIRTELDKTSFDRLLAWAYIADATGKLVDVGELMRARSVIGW